MRRVAGVMTLGWALAACAGGNLADKNPAAGDWNIRRGYDRILGKPTATASLLTRGRNTNTHPLTANFTSIQLLCFDNVPIVRMDFLHKVGSNRTSVVHYRFDDNPGRSVTARFLQNYKTVVIEERDDVARFVDELRASRKLYVRVSSHLAGTSIVDFDIRGAEIAADAAYQNCPLASPPRPRISEGQSSHVAAG
jgi:hypothetical protein